MIAKSKGEVNDLCQEPMHRVSAVVPLILCGLAGAFLSATIVFALGKTLGVVLLAYVVGGSAFALVGALSLLVTSPKVGGRVQTQEVET